MFTNMEEIDNVTRRKPLVKSKSLEKIDSFSSRSSDSIDLMGKSLDLSSHLLSSHVEDMKSEIGYLKSTLQSTQNELENVIIENNDLKRQLSQLAQEVSVLKKICKSPLSSLRRTASLSSKKSARRRLIDSFNVSPLSLQNNDSVMLPSSSCLKHNTKQPYMEQPCIGQPSIEQPCMEQPFK